MKGCKKQNQKKICPGCFPVFLANQEAHMAYDGCLYVEDDDEKVDPLEYEVEEKYQDHPTEKELVNM
jgi:hypothetical protein